MIEEKYTSSIVVCGCLLASSVDAATNLEAEVIQMAEEQWCGSALTKERRAHTMLIQRLMTSCTIVRCELADKYPKVATMAANRVMVNVVTAVVSTVTVNKVMVAVNTGMVNATAEANSIGSNNTIVSNRHRLNIGGSNSDGLSRARNSNISRARGADQLQGEDPC
ncbi:hypothetical protein GW943_00170 [Candidatus Parcubacteria bacterium]|nr:hypothetical protein [Candidatus Parcubacteria bacterium]